MTSSRDRSPRRTPRRVGALAAALVVSAAVFGGYSSVGSQAEAASAPSATVASHGHAGGGDGTPEGRSPGRTTQHDLHQGMQTLWQQHMEWTYAAIAAFAVDSPGFSATADRLMQNQVDIGDAIKPFYGDAAGDQLTTLLQDHIAGAVAILTAAKAGDAAALDQAVTDEYANARAIGAFLAAANSTNWAEADMEAMMETHIDQTLVYATDLLTGDFAQGIVDYDEAEAHMIDMSDMLSTGIIDQFPSSFTK